VNDDPTALWTDATRTLRDAMDDATFDLWVAPLVPVSFVGGTLQLSAPDAIRDWVHARLRRVLEEAASASSGAPVRVDIVAPGLTPAARVSAGTAASGRGSHGGSSGTASHLDEPVAIDEGPGLNPKYTFEQFVIGEANRIAHAAALAAAELPGQTYNPLFLYGRPGVGKTHLLHAIGNYVRAHDPTLTVRCTTAEHFTNDFLQALQSGKGPGITHFKARYRRVDLLLIDDVQFLERKARTEEEFFHTFNALRDGGAQVVLTSDRLPRDLDQLEARLRERFDAGLVADIAPPDIAIRMAVLRKRAALDGIDADDDALALIADRIDANVRALEAALIRTVAFSSLTGRALDVELAQRVLDDLYPAAAVSRRQPVSVDDVIALVAAAFAVTPEELRSSSREQRISWPRQVAMHLAREHTDQSLPAIARAFGARAHTTVLHACRRTIARLDEDPAAKALVHELSTQLADREGDR
jgi:chromosomal replication initiator protein